MTLNELVRIAHRDAVANGWWEGERNFGELLALVHSEVSEALEEYRKGQRIDETRLVDKGYALLKPEGIPSELADIVIRVADICGAYDIDLEWIVLEKLSYNRSRGYRHGGKRA